MGITSMHRVCTRSKCYTFLSSIRCCSCIFSIGNIGCNGQNRCCLDTATVSMVSFYISDKGVEHLFCDLVNTIVVISIFREISSIKGVEITAVKGRSAYRASSVL